MTSLNTACICERIDNTFNINLGRVLFSDPQATRENAIVVSNGSARDEGVNVGDLVKIDFTRNTIDRDGLYVITLDDNYICYRRFQYAPELKVLEHDGTVKVTPEMLQRTKVVGLVKEIYRSTLKN